MTGWEPIRTSPLHMGTSDEGKRRLAVLQELATQFGYTFDEKPSLSRMLQAIADGTMTTADAERLAAFASRNEKEQGDE